MAIQLTRAFLLEGVVRAIHASRMFLRDAISLLDDGRFATAYIAGIIAIEQLGRANWMLSRYDQMVQKGHTAINGKKFAQELREVTHHSNLRGGIMAVSMTTTPEMEKVTEQIQTLKAGTPEFEEAAKAYKQIYADAFDNHAKAYHKTRQQVQYVNPDDTCATWTTPLHATCEDVSALLSNVGAANRVIFVIIEHRSDILNEMDRLGVRNELQDWRDTLAGGRMETDHPTSKADGAAKEAVNRNAVSAGYTVRQWCAMGGVR